MSRSAKLSGFRAGLEKLSARERLLAALILAAALALWATMLLRDLAATRERLATVESARMAQDAWLNAAPVIDKALAAKSSGLAVARSLDAEAVMGRLEKLLAKAGLAAESSRPLTREAGPCRAHTVSLRTESATMAQLIAFRRALDASGLPMAITALELESSDSRDTSLLRARIDITALQPKEDAR